MAFNFTNNPFQFIEMYNRFKQYMSTVKRNPAELLEEELKRRNVSNDQIEQLKQSAQALKNILGGRL